MTSSDIDSEFIERSLLLYAHAFFIADTLFEKHPSFVKALEDGITLFVNRDATTVKNAISTDEDYVEKRIDRHKKWFVARIKGSTSRAVESAEEGGEGACENDESGGGSSKSNSNSGKGDDGLSPPPDIPPTPSVSQPPGTSDQSEAMDLGPSSGINAAPGSSSLEGSKSSSSSSSLPSSSSSSSSFSFSSSSSSSSSSLSGNGRAAVSHGQASQVAMLAAYCDKSLKVLSSLSYYVVIIISVADTVLIVISTIFFFIVVLSFLTSPCHQCHPFVHLT